MNYELKPCPFCGGEAELDTRRQYRALVSGRREKEMAVYCLSCTAEVSVCISDVPDIQPEQMVDMWNSRAEVMANQPVAKERDELLAVSGHLSVGTSVDRRGITVVVSFTQGNQTTVLYSGSHPPDGDGLGVLALQQGCLRSIRLC